MDKGDEAAMMMMHLQIETCEQLTVLLQREVRYRPAATATTTTAGASAADLERQGSSRTVVQGPETHDQRTALCVWAFQVVNHSYIPTDSVHVAFNLFDRYNAARFKHASNQVSKTTTECTACEDHTLPMVASLYIALKLKNYIYLPPFSSHWFASLSRGQGKFTDLDVEAMEAKLLGALDWLVYPPTCHEFVHGYVALLILVHEQEQEQRQQEQRQQEQQFRFNLRRRRFPETNWTTTFTDSPGGSYITPVSGTIQFHYGMFSNGAYGYSKRTPTYRGLMESQVYNTACQILDQTVADYGFVRFKPSTVACAALYYAMQQHYDEGHFYHIYHHHPFPSPLEQLHRLGVMVDAMESSMCIESIYLLYSEAPATPAQEQQSKKNRSKEEGNTTKRTTSPQNIMEQLDAVDDP